MQNTEYTKEVQDNGQPQRTGGEVGVQRGFSQRIDTPEFAAAMGASNRSHTIIMALVCLLLAPLLTLVVALLSPQSRAVLLGACVVVEIIVAIIVVRILVKRYLGKSWDGEVIDQHVERERRGNSRRKQNVYVTRFRTDAGESKKHKERTIHRIYDYLKVGDRVRYHPQLNYPFEKEDKTADTYLLCPFCGSVQPIENDVCDVCAKPLLK